MRQIVVATALTGAETVELTVADTGSGISTEDKEKLGGHIQVLDWTRSYDFLSECELDSRYDYDDGFYRGAYDYYEDCSGTADYMVLAAVPKQGSDDILILLEVQIVSDADFDAAERILQTFDIVGSLP